MSKPFLAAFAGAILVLACVVMWIFQAQSGFHLVPTGSIVSVRTAPMDPGHSVLVLDFTVTDPSDRGMVIRTIEVTVHKADGTAVETSAIAASDIPQMFRFYKDLGPVRNPPLREREAIAPHQTVRRSTAVQLSVPQSDLESRRDVQLVIEDVTGPKLELQAK